MVVKTGRRTKTSSRLIVTRALARLEPKVASDGRAGLRSAVDGHGERWARMAAV
jgi:hypothetical protein